jgi:hypothetical protein
MSMVFTRAFIRLQIRQMLHVQFVISVSGVETRLPVALELDVAGPPEVRVRVRFR